MAQMNFTATHVASSQPIPDGWYSAVITKTDVTMKNGTPDLFVEYTVTEGEQANRRIFEHIRFETEVGSNILSVLLECVGLNALTDSDELLGKRIGVKTQNAPGSDGKTWTNVRGHKLIAVRTTMPEHKFTPADAAPF